MTAVERLARELFDVAYPGVDWNGHPGSHFIRLAHHVLRRERAAVRRARGRTLGWCLKPLGDSWSYLRVEPKRRSLHVARVVAEPKRKVPRG